MNVTYPFDVCLVCQEDWTTRLVDGVVTEDNLCEFLGNAEFVRRAADGHVLITVATTLENAIALEEAGAVVEETTLEVVT